MAKKLLETDRIVKYVKARSRGLSKERSKAIAGYSPETKAVTIERSEPYKALSIKEGILAQISEKEIIAEHVGLIKQHDDKAIKMQAIKVAYDRIEPDTVKDDDVDVVSITMKK